MSRHARIEVRPVDDRYRREQEAWGTPAPHVKPSARPHYLRLVAANGQVLAHSENYSTRQNARRAVKAWAEAFESVCRNYYGGASEMAVIEFDADGREVTR